MLTLPQLKEIRKRPELLSQAAGTIYKIAETAIQALEELEEIKKELGYQLDQGMGMQMELERVKAENARLREALKENKKVFEAVRTVVSDNPPEWNYQWDGLQMLAKEQCKNIEQALQEVEHEETKSI
jgi:hypothetical protein